MGIESKHLSELIEANKRLHRARDAFFSSGDNKSRARAVSHEVDRALAAEPSVDAGLRLMLLSDLLVEIPGQESVQCLLRILGHEDPGIRVSAGEALVEVLSDRWGEASRVVETAVDRTLTIDALRELPFVLAEVGEPSASKIIAKLLSHEDADVVASAIEALVELGDRSQLEAIRRLVDDPRPLSAEDEDEGDEEASAGATLGDLAADAVEVLSQAPER
jgi:HEAT repeat protein